MDQGSKTRKMGQYLKQIEQRSGSLSKGQKWNLLNKLFGLRPSEIAEMEGLDKKSSSVRQLIIRVSDQLKAGEICLIETTPEESAAAKARLDEANLNSGIKAIYFEKDSLRGQNLKRSRKPEQSGEEIPKALGTLQLTPSVPALIISLK
jgi:hypothetical protein